MEASLKTDKMVQSSLLGKKCLIKHKKNFL